jgi:hypothetical protein
MMIFRGGGVEWEMVGSLLRHRTLGSYYHIFLLFFSPHAPERRLFYQGGGACRALLPMGGGLGGMDLTFIGKLELVGGMAHGLGASFWSISSLSWVDGWVVPGLVGMDQGGYYPT